MAKKRSSPRTQLRQRPRPDPAKNRAILGIALFSLAVFTAIIWPTSTMLSSPTGYQIAPLSGTVPQGIQAASLCTTQSTILSFAKKCLPHNKESEIRAQYYCGNKGQCTHIQQITEDKQWPIFCAYTTQRTP